MIKKKLLVGIIFLVLTISLVFGSQLVDDYKIEKQGNKIYIYKLVGVTDNTKLKDDKDKIDKEFLELTNLKNNLEEDCSYCIFETKQGFWDSEKECKIICEKEGSQFTELERVYLEELIQEKQKEKDKLEKIK